LRESKDLARHLSAAQPTAREILRFAQDDRKSAFLGSSQRDVARECRSSPSVILSEAKDLREAINLLFRICQAVVFLSERCASIALEVGSRPYGHSVWDRKPRP